MKSKSPSSLVQRTANGMLDLLKSRPERLPTEAEFAASLDVSRSPVRAAADILVRRGVLRRDGSGLALARAPRASDRFDVGETVSKREAFERFFLERLRSGDLLPGRRFSELELARVAGLTTVTVREGLQRYARFGLIRKDPRRQWEVVKFDEAMIDELFELRQILEHTALKKTLALPGGHPVRAQLEQLLDDHRVFAKAKVHDIDAFLALDERLHGTLFQSAGNRYLDEMYSAIPALIHFQLRRDPIGRRGMELGIVDHIDILSAIIDRDAEKARQILRRHIDGARGIMKMAAEHRQILANERKGTA